MKCPPRCRSSWRLLTGRTEPNWQLRRPAQHERAAADAPATASFQCESQKGHAHSADGRLTVGEARQREPAGLDGQTQQSRLRIMARHISPAVNSASRSRLSAAESKEQPCDIATLARFPDRGLGYFCRVGGSNEAKTITGADALISMDSVCGARLRVRRLPPGHCDIRGPSRFI